MKKYLLAIVLILAGAAVGFMAPRGRSSKNTVSAVGICNAKVARDKLAITLIAKSVDINAAASLRNAQKTADDIVRAIRTIDDSTIEIQTTNVSSYEKTKWENNTQVSLGVESTIGLSVTTGNKETLSAILDRLPAGVMPQNMRNFSSQPVIAEATAKCIHAAIEDARVKAATIAAGDGEKIGRLVSAGFGDFDSDPDFRPVLMKSRAASYESADFIQSSDGDLTITVSAAFSIR